MIVTFIGSKMNSYSNKRLAFSKLKNFCNSLRLWLLSENLSKIKTNYSQ